MNVFNKLTVQTLKKNKTRTIVTIFGIMLSAAMICAVTTFVSSFMNFGRESIIYTEGDWHSRQCNTDYETYESIANNEKVEKAAYMQQIGYANAENSELYYKPYIYVAGVNENAQDILPIHIAAGSYPKSSSEIILSEQLYTKSGIKYNIGDEITLDLGQRVLNNKVLTQDDPCYVNGDEFNGETLEIKETRTYTIVGFYKQTSDFFEKYLAPGFTAFTIADNTPSADYKYDVYFRMDNPNDLSSFIQKQHLSGDNNDYVLAFSGVILNPNIIDAFYSLIAIIMIIIIFASVALIYNAFSISVSERTKLFGLLSSVGATKKQIRRMVIFESLAVSTIGIPLGILAGIGGIGITLLFIGDMFYSESFPSGMTLSVSPISIVFSILIALITVLISAWIPSKRATKVSAVEAIRQHLDIKTNGKKTKTSKLIYKLFGMPGVIADKHYKRNKRKYRTTVLSLFMSIVLFVSSSAYMNYLIVAAEGKVNTQDYDISTDIERQQFDRITPDQLYDELKEAKSVTDVFYSQILSASMEIKDEYLSEKGRSYFEEVKRLVRDSSEFTNKLYVNFVFLDDNAFKKLLKENGLSEQEYMNPNNPLAIAVDGKTIYDPEINVDQKIYMYKGDNFELEIEKGKYIEGYQQFGEGYDENGNEILDENGNKTFVYEKQKGSKVEGDDKIYVSQEEAFSKTNIKVGKVINEAPSYILDDGKLMFIYPNSLAKSVFEDFNGGDYSCYRIVSSDHTASYTAIQSILADNGIVNTYINDVVEAEISQRNVITLIRVFSYGFIVLISLIAAANVFNTISTNISLRRREFAMLKSIGMTQKDFNKMMNFECLLYGVRALLYGLPVSIIISYLIYKNTANIVRIPIFQLPWEAIGIAVLSVFLVVFTTMLYAMRKIKKDNPIDTLRNENI